jgi:hypothetical protein
MKNCLLLAFIIPAIAHAQTKIDVNDTIMRNNITYNTRYGGIPVINPKYFKVVEGSVFFPENFTTALLFTADSKRPYVVDARINVLDERLHYLDEKNREMQSESPIEEVHFIENNITIAVFRIGMLDCSEKASGCFEVMEKGKATLYRKLIKKIEEFKPYGSATVEQKVLTSYQYWIQAGNACQAVKNLQELQSILLQADPAFRQKIPPGKLSDKDPQSWTTLVSSFNK